jgi:hypothetical protein
MHGRWRICAKDITATTPAYTLVRGRQRSQRCGRSKRCALLDSLPDSRACKVTEIGAPRRRQVQQGSHNMKEAHLRTPTRELEATVVHEVNAAAAADDETTKSATRRQHSKAQPSLTDDAYVGQLPSTSSGHARCAHGHHTWL